MLCSNINNISTMTLKNFYKYKKEKESEALSKSIQSKAKISDDLNNNKISNNNNINVLKKSSSGKNSFISRYDSNNRNNKTIHIENKRDLLLNNKFFFSTSELGNITDIININNKYQKTVNENKFNDKIMIRNKSSFNEDKNDSIKQLIKVNTKIGRDGSSKPNYNSYSKSRDNCNAKNGKMINERLSQNHEQKSTKNKNSKSIKYNGSFTQKKFYLNEKIQFLIKKMNKIIYSKIFQYLKEKFRDKNSKLKKPNIPNRKQQSNDKNKPKLNLSSKKRTSKNKNKDKEKDNIYKQTQKNKNPRVVFGNLLLNRPPSQLSIFPSKNNISSHINNQFKQKDIKTRINQSSILDNIKSKINKSKNKRENKVHNNSINSKDRSILLKNKKNNNSSQKNIIDKKCKKNIKIKEKNNLLINNDEMELIKSLSNNNFKEPTSKEDIHHYNTEISSQIINSIYNNNNAGRICKVYENCLLDENKMLENRISDFKYGNKPKYKKDKIMEYASSPSPKNLNNINFPFMKKNASPKSNMKMSINIKANNINNNKIGEKIPYFPKYDLNTFNIISSNLYESTPIKYALYRWYNIITKKKIINIFANRNKIKQLVNKSDSIIMNKIKKLFRCLLLKIYFNRYFDAYSRKKILEKMKNNKNNAIKCINIPIRQKSGCDIINNININNYINYSDLNKFMKKRAQSPVVLSKLIMPSKDNNKYNQVINNGNIFDEQNKNVNISNMNYANNLKYNYKCNNYNNNYVPLAQTDRMHNNLYSPMNISVPKLANKNKFCFNDMNNNDKKELNMTDMYSNNNKYYENNVNKRNVLIDQVNQLRMVFNLLEQHENKNNNIYECFHKWLYDTKLGLKIKNKCLFWSFTGNNNCYNIFDEGNQVYQKYSVNTYKGKDYNNGFSVKKNNITSIEIGKYTPVRGIKSFRSKTSQKGSDTHKIFEYNDTKEVINKNSNVIKNSPSLINNYSNKSSVNMVYHKKKLINPNILSINNNCFLEYNTNTYTNNSYLINFDNYEMNTYKKSFYKNKNNNFSNIEINNSINSFYLDNYNKGNFNVNPNGYKSSVYIPHDYIQEKKIEIKKMNKIEEKEINFAQYRRNKSYNKISKIIPQYNENKDNNIEGNKFNLYLNENKSDKNNNVNINEIKIIYRKGKNFMNNFNNNISYSKKIKIYSNNNNNINNIFKKNNKIKKNNSNKNGSNKINKSMCYINHNYILKNIEQSNKLNYSFSYVKNKIIL